MQDIGTRMKSYESNRRLAKGAVIIRVDGKGFHTWTKQIQAEKPFDRAVIDCMFAATEQTAQRMQGFSLAYTQSDESTFLLTTASEKSELWFGGKLDKVVSITASMFTYYFNDAFKSWVILRGYPDFPAFFDARAHNIPLADAANSFYWRQLDWIRNSVTMLGRAHFTHKQMLNKSAAEVKQMLLDTDVDWDKLEAHKKYGVFINNVGKGKSKQLNYDQINALAGINAPDTA